MAAHLHTCMAEGCAKQISRGLLMCIDHWRMVPVATQQRVKRAWRAVLASADAVPEHSAACRDAVAAVLERELKRQARRCARQNGLFDGGGQCHT